MIFLLSCVAVVVFAAMGESFGPYAANNCNCVYNNGICTETEGETHYEEAVLNDNGTPDDASDDYYEIANAGNLYWFASEVNGGNASANAKLTDDITVNPGAFDKDGNYIKDEDEPEGTSPMAWTPIGNGIGYAGTFDGDYCTVYGLYSSDSDSQVGLFGLVGENAFLRNVTVKNSYFVSHSGEGCGAIAGDSYGTIENCHNDGSYVVGDSESGSNIGGVVGVTSGTSATVSECSNTGAVSGKTYVGGVVGGFCGGTVENCYNTGAVSGEAYVGGVVGAVDAASGNVSVRYCFNTGALTASSSFGGIIGALNEYSTLTLKSLYYLKNDGDTILGIGGTVSDTDGQTIPATSARFRSGEITYKLNDGNTDYYTTVWKQIIGEDDTPGFSSYVVEYGYVSCDETKGMTYGNYTYDTRPDHSTPKYITNGNGTHSWKCPDCHNVLDDGEHPTQDCTIVGGYCNICGGEHTHTSVDADGFCTECGLSASVPTKDSNGVYQIETVAHLYWFAQYINNTNYQSESNFGGAKLMRDIEINKDVVIKDENGNYVLNTEKVSTFRKWTPIGKADDYGYGIPYYANFYPNGHKISGLYCVMESGYAGFFGNLGPFAIEGLHIADSYFDGDSAGAIAGYCNSPSFSKCSVGENVIVNGKVKAGGIAANGHCTIENSFVLAQVSAPTWGGFAGEYADVSNSFTNSKRPAGNYFSGDYDNVYYLYDDTDYDGEGTTGYKPVFPDGANEMQATDFSNGKLVWLLQDGVKGEFLGYDNDWNEIYGTPSQLWYQTLGDGGDAYPNFDSTHGIVYKKINDGCAGAPDQFSNNENDHFIGDHTFTATSNGFCIICDAYQPAALNETGGYYEISNAGNLYWFAAEVNISGNTEINAKLTDDIKVNDNVLVDGALAPDKTNFRQWTPIGNGNYNSEEGKYYRYSGTFDGDGHTISGLYFSGDDVYVGLFGNICATTIKNVGVIDSYLATAPSGEVQIGGIAGQVNSASSSNTVISGCSYSGILDGKDNSEYGRAHVGGIVGLADYNTTIKNCYSTGSFSGSGASAANVGGIVGYTFVNKRSVEITGCYSTSTFAGTSKSVSIGGVAGKVHCYDGALLSVTDCYYLSGTATDAFGSVNNKERLTSDSVSAVTETQLTSGEVTWLLNGKTSEGTTEAPLVWKQTIDGTSHPGFIGGTVYSGYKYCSDTDRHYANSAEGLLSAKPDHTYSTDGFCTVCDAYQPAVLGDTGDCYEISNAGNLYWFAAEVNSGNVAINARLTGNITVNPGTFDKDGNYTKSESEKDGAQPRVWTPIGNFYKRYIGTFDGMGYTVSGLYVNDTIESRVGLFGYVGEIIDTEGENYVYAGTVQNVTVANTYFYGYQIGGISANNDNIISNCHFSGYIVAKEQYGNAGGIVNNNLGTISNCSNSGTVSAENASGAFIGGIVGTQNSGTISNCFNTGTISGSDIVGGIAGALADGEVLNCYNSGTVTGKYWAGAVVGSQIMGTATNCYYLEGSATDSDGTVQGGIGCEHTGMAVVDIEGSTAGMTGGAFTSGEVTYKLNGSTSDGDLVWKQTIDGKSYPGFTGGTVYSYTDCSNAAYYANTVKPNGLHRAFDQDGFCTACGGYQPAELSDGVYLIKNGGNLFWFSELVNGKKPLDANGNEVAQNASADARLTADIYLNRGTIDASGNFTPSVAGTEVRTWVPIGGYYDSKTYSRTKYSGNFDGAKYDESGEVVKNYTISGMYYKNTSGEYIGVFGYITGTVKNITVKNSYVSGYFYIGAIAGYATGSITNCTNNGYVSSENVRYVGGIAGYSESLIANCTNSADFSGEMYIGGIVGRSGGSIANCTNSGDITATEEYAGGIVGQFENGDGSVTSCTNTGNITSESYAGGIAGISKGTIANCANVGSKTADGNGGFVYTGKIVATDDRAGGVVADNYGTISKCSNSGEVSGNGSNTIVGGVTAYSAGNISDCFNTGDVIAGGTGRYYGGVVGISATGSAVKNCYSTGDIKPASSSARIQTIGGVVGVANGDGTVSNCYYIQTQTVQKGVGSYSGSDTITSVEAKSEDDFGSGAVTFLLNGERSEGTTDEPLHWFQTCGEGLPAFEGKTVYRFSNCAGVYSYDNVSTSDGSHIYKNGICNLCHQYEPSMGGGTETDPFKIGNMGNLYWFSALVNTGNYTLDGDTVTIQVNGEDVTGAVPGAWAILTGNITVNDKVLDGGKPVSDTSNLRAWTPIGIYDCHYTGTFDGKSYSISGLYYSEGDSYAGLFGYIDGATVKNVTVKDSYFYGNKYVGGIVGCSAKGTEISGCTNEAVIEVHQYGGGIVGLSEGTVRNCANYGSLTGYQTRNRTDMFIGGVAGESTTQAVLENCYNVAKISGTSYIGGIAGSNSGMAKLMNCYNIGEVSGTNYVGGIAGSKTTYATVTNCYYLTGCATDGNGTVQFGIGSENTGETTADEAGSTVGTTVFSTGEITWKLNLEKSDGVWKQTLSGDKKQDYPGFVGGTVYYGYTTCKSTSKSYSNTVTYDTVPDHSYENGFCTICGDFEAAVWNAEQNCYLIYNAGQLYWFAAKTNGAYYDAEGNLQQFSDQDASVNAKLMDNIIVNPGTFDENGSYTKKASETLRTFLPIALGDRYGYAGTFDGNGKYISGLYFSGDYNTQISLFACVKSGGIVRNVTVKNSFFKGAELCGAVVGVNHGTVEGCANDGTIVIVTDGSVGGVVGANSGTVKNCYSTGAVTGKRNVGGVVGYNNNTDASANAVAAVENCYSIGSVTITGTDGSIGGIVGKNFEGNVKNCYYLDSTAAAGIGVDAVDNPVADTDDVSGATADRFASGEIAYRLNGSRFEGTAESPLVWYQTLSGDDRQSAPSFTGKTVYYDEDRDEYSNERTAFVSVTVTWTSMEFTYTEGEWSAETHSYADGTWESDGGTVTVENIGTLSVTVSFAYNETVSGIDGTFDKTSIELAANETGTTALTLSGRPGEQMSKMRLGNITVTIAKKSG